jgi:phage replication initiation protein
VLTTLSGLLAILPVHILPKNSEPGNTDECSSRASSGFPVPAVYTLADVHPVGVPPHSNTGVTNTKPDYKADVSIDWIAGTVHGVGSEEVKYWFSPPGVEVDWTPLDRGAMGYKSCLERAGIRVYHDGNVGMGVHVVISGKAVRSLEHEQGLDCEEAWQAWLGDLLAKGFKFARFDSAFDDVGDGHVLDMSTIWEAAKARNVVTPFHKARRRGEEEYNLHETGAAPCAEGETIRFGSRTSNMFVRIYNKAQEQLSKGVPLPADFHWIRVEQEFKHEAAVKAVEFFVRFGFECFAMLLRNQLDFKVPSSDSNKSRWVTVAWWDTFLGGCVKARLRVCKVVERSVEAVKAWLTRQAAPSLAVLADAIQKECLVTGADYRRSLSRVLSLLLEGGRERYKCKHLKLLADYSPSLAFGGGVA